MTPRPDPEQLIDSALRRNMEADWFSAHQLLRSNMTFLLASLEGHLRRRRAAFSSPQGLPSWTLGVSEKSIPSPFGAHGWWLINCKTSGTHRTLFPFRPTHPSGSHDTPTHTHTKKKISSWVRFIYLTVAAYLCHIHWFVCLAAASSLCALWANLSLRRSRIRFNFFVSYILAGWPEPPRRRWMAQCSNVRIKDDAIWWMPDITRQRTYCKSMHFHPLTLFNVQYGRPSHRSSVCVWPSHGLSENAADAQGLLNSLNIFVKSWGLAGTRRSIAICLISHQREQMGADIERVSSHLIWRGSAVEQTALNKACKTPQQTNGCYRNSSARKIQSLSSRLNMEKCW